MTRIQVEPDVANRGIRFSGLISDRDLSFDQKRILEDVRRELVSRIVDRLIEKIGQPLDDAIIEAFTQQEGGRPD